MKAQRLCFAITLLVCFFATLPQIGTAVVTPDDEFFENVRGQLLQYFSSEVVAHSGLIIGLIIGSFALIAVWKDFWKNGSEQDIKRKSDFIRKIIFLVLLGLAFSLTLYCVGRLFYWSYLGADILPMNSNHFIIDDSNATKLIMSIQDSAMSDYNSGQSLSLKFSKSLQPTLGDNLSVVRISITMLTYTLLPLGFWGGVWTPLMDRQTLKFRTKIALFVLFLLCCVVIAASYNFT